MLVPVVFMVALLAVAAPIVAALLIARHDSFAAEQTRARTLAGEIVRRADMTAAQMRMAFAGLEAFRGQDPCSIEGTRRMTGAVLEFDQIQGAGFARDDRLICTSAGPLNPPVVLGTPQFRLLGSFAYRTGVRLPLARDIGLIAISAPSGYTLFIHPALTVDMPLVSNREAIGVVSIPARGLLNGRGPVDLDLLRPFFASGQTQYVVRGRLVSIERSARGRYAGFAILPTDEVQAGMRSYLLFLLPLGLVCGVVLVLLLGVRRRSEARFALALDSPGAGIFDWDLRTGDLMWTPRAESGIGLPPGALNRIEKWEARVEPEDRIAIARIQDEVERRRGDHFLFRYRLRADSGELRTFKGTARCFYDSNGRIVRLVGINLDVTESEEREAQLRSIFQNTPDALFVIAEDGEISSASPSAESVFGYGEQELLGKNFAELLGGEEKLRAFYRRARRSGVERASDARPILLAAVRASGEEFPAEVTLAEAASRRGTILVVFVRDVTDRVNAQQRLDALRDEFSHQNRLNAMGELAAGLAHEINQPLTAGVNFLTVLEAKVRNQAPDLGELVVSIRTQLLRAGEIIRRLREFIARGEADMRVEPVEETILDAIAVGLVGQDRTRIQVDCNVAPGAEQMLADRVQVQQILVNLLRNAAQATRNLAPERRRISVEAWPLNHELLEIRVLDQGPGFAPDLLHRLFTPFLSTKDSAEGMGVGLSISRKIVEAHGGEMRAFNQDTGGACVAFTLRRPSAPGE
jgi:PAS domain S-box-containing protein